MTTSRLFAIALCYWIAFPVLAAGKPQSSTRPAPATASADSGGGASSCETTQSQARRAAERGLVTPASDAARVESTGASLGAGKGKPPAHARRNAAKPEQAKKPKKGKTDCMDFGRPCQPPAVAPAAFDTSPGSGPLPKWAFLTNGLGSESAQLVLSVENDSLAPGAGLTLDAPGPARGQLWRTASASNGAATFWSGLGNSIALSVDLTQPSPIPAVTYPSQIPADTDVASASAFQTWSYFSNDGSIVNQASAGQLYASAKGAPVVLSNASGPGAEWSAWPSYPLDSILEQTPIPFPTGSDAGEVCAYQYINAQLGLSDDTCTLSGQSLYGIRCEYSNLAATLSDYKSTLDHLSQPSAAQAGCAAGVTISSDDWSDVTSQLDTEITYADNVRGLYSAASGFFGDVFLDDGDSLTTLAGYANVSQHDQVGLAALTLIEGSLYTVLSALGPEASVAANIFETAVNTAVALPGSGVDTEYVDAVSALYGDLSVAFCQVVTTLADQETQILTDWGKLAAAGPLTTKLDAPDSLAWPTSNDELLPYFTAGYDVVAMQALLPVQYSVTRIVGQVDSGGRSDDQLEGEWAEQIATQTNGDPLWNQYAATDTLGNPPSSDALGVVFDNGVSPHDFFNGSNGWEGLAPADTPAALDGSVDVCNAAVIEFTNWSSSHDLVLTVDPAEGRLGGNQTALANNADDVSGTNASVSVPVPPYGSTLIAGAYATGLAFDVSVGDPCATVQSLTLHQEYCGDLTFDTWIDTLASAPGCGATDYPTSSSVTNTSLFGPPGKLSLGVYRAPQPPPSITLVNPEHGFTGQTGLLVDIDGNNFQYGASCDFGPDITVGQAGCLFLDSGRLQANLSISESAAPGARTVTVTNPEGEQAFGSFLVEFQPLIPVVTAIVPDIGNPGEQLTFTILGSNFEEGATCDFGPDITYPTFPGCQWISANQIVANLTIATSAASGPRTVTVTNPDGEQAQGTLVISGLPPTLESTAPSVGVVGQRLETVIAGTNFMIGAACDFGRDITVNSCQGVPGRESSRLLADITIAPDALFGLKTVTVTNPDKSSVSGRSFWVRLPGQAVIDYIDPPAGRQGETLTLVLHGAGFEAPVTLSGSYCDPEGQCFTPLSFGSATVDSSTQVTVSVTIGPNAVAHLRHPFALFNGNGGLSFGFFEVLPSE